MGAEDSRKMAEMRKSLFGEYLLTEMDAVSAAEALAAVEAVDMKCFYSRREVKTLFDVDEPGAVHVTCLLLSRRGCDGRTEGLFWKYGLFANMFLKEIDHYIEGSR